MSNQNSTTIYQSLEELENAEVRIQVPPGEERIFVFSYFGDKDVALDLQAEINEGANLKVLGVVHNSKGGSVNVRTLSHHVGPGSTADVLVKAIVANDSSFDYYGMIKIEKAAQQTDSYLTNNILLLDKKARANTEPSLEIEADDVKASHGATLGSVDAGMIFYLRSRGISEEQAKRMIVEGFLSSVIEKVEDAKIKKTLLRYLSNLGDL